MSKLKKIKVTPLSKLNLEDLSKAELISRIHKMAAHIENLNSGLKKANSCANELSLSHFTNSEEVSAKYFESVSIRRVALKILYLGWDLDGYNIQENTAKTIEECLFCALLKSKLIKSHKLTNYQKCGRTDKGVSSFSQVISIDLRSSLTSEELENEEEFLSKEINYPLILNANLPSNIRVVAWAPVKPDFDARYFCCSRSYKYLFPRSGMDVAKMQEAADHILAQKGGDLDLRNFCKMDVRNGVLVFTRDIYEIRFERLYASTYLLNLSSSSSLGLEHQLDDMYQVTIKASSFLMHQIRHMMSIFFLIGLGRESPEIVLSLLDCENGFTSKPQYDMVDPIPLFFWDCEYKLPENENNFSIPWITEATNIQKCIKTLQFSLTEYSVKKSMIESMIFSLKDMVKDKSEFVISADKNNERSFNELNNLARIFLEVGKRHKSLDKRPNALPLQKKIEKHIEKGILEYHD